MIKTPVNIVVGRFQPFTDGHMYCVLAAKKQLGINTVICLIDTPDDKVDARHPFPSSMMLPIYKELDGDYKSIIDVVLVKNADIVKIGELLNDKYEIKSWTCGTDRIHAYTEMTKRYADKAGLPSDFQMIEVKRSDEDISAARVRKALLDGDKRTFEKLTPYNTLKNYMKEPDKIYNMLRAQILKVTDF